MKDRIAVVVVSSFALVLGCSLAPVAPSSLTLSNALKIDLNNTKKSEIESTFGPPDNKEVEGEIEKWTYNFPKTQSQRMTVEFSQDSSQVNSILWIPQEPLEASISHIQSLLPGVNFQVVEPEQKMHFISSEITYVDRAKGIMILSKKGSNKAQAVVRTEPIGRSAATNE